MGECCSRDAEAKPAVNKPSRKQKEKRSQSSSGRTTKESTPRGEPKPVQKNFTEATKKIEPVRATNLPVAKPEESEEEYTQESEIPDKFKRKYRVAMAVGERPRSAKPRMRTQALDYVGRKFVIVTTNYAD
mmetsp:Transcript_6504/g.11393  ORF Transcript_6504/g.11393 Transcript_6504/m.11393 type:complete len:131 (+) Transcript_6504:37-429(+)